MGGNGRFRRWRISFHRSLSAAKKDPPPEFLCPISNSLMFDPAIVSCGQTFERACVDVCRSLSFAPTLSDGSQPDFTTVIPNLALKSAILSWCKQTGSGRPCPPDDSEIESSIRSISGSIGTLESPKIWVSETPNSRDLNFSSSSEESVIANSTPLLPFATRPSCFSYSSSPSTSSEFVAEEGSTNAAASSEEENFIARMGSLDVYEQEQAVIQLRKTTRTSEEARAALCSERLLQALKQLLSSRYAALQTNAAAAMVNISLERGNKVKIVRAGAVPPLIDILKSGFDEAREHAAGAIFSLALDNGNKTVIGALGAMPPLLLELRSGTRRQSRQDAALALYHLTLVQSNRAKVVRLGAAPALLGLLGDRDVSACVVLTVCNLAACDEGRAALLDANAVDCLVGLLRDRAESGSESTRENCVAALHSLSDRSMRFKGLARDAGAVEVLLDVAKADSERARVMTRGILEGLRGPETGEDGEEVDWEAVMKGGVTRARHRVGKSSSEL
ncbi:plant U-box 38 [Salvia divinorum]|uniref:RING-type E3 ubiquitin transferase n=1 Tax=Salvia divinorum TaxID=28513 RepID=A0ABD1IEQ6_SALDI